ncbi:MAG TPA: hypothetical protein VMF65_06135 [Acidimicrobiales bacterium]|nr:hypothetical protein [Acidimicrobiales bacterium]
MNEPGKLLPRPPHRKPTRRKLSRWSRRLALVLAVAALAIAPSACGSGHSNGTTTTTTIPSGY